MEPEELDRLANAGAATPRGLGYADTLYFLMVRSLYQFARAASLTPEDGRREKAKIVEAVRRYRNDEQHAVQRAALNRDTGAARAAYRKARRDMGNAAALYLPPEAVAVIAAADRLVEIMDGMQIGADDNGMV